MVAAEVGRWTAVVDVVMLGVEGRRFVFGDEERRVVVGRSSALWDWVMRVVVERSSGFEC